MTPCPHRGRIIESCGLCYCRHPEVGGGHRVDLEQCEACEFSSDPPLKEQRDVPCRFRSMAKVRDAKCGCADAILIPVYRCSHPEIAGECVIEHADKGKLKGTTEADAALRRRKACETCRFWERAT